MPLLPLPDRSNLPWWPRGPGFQLELHSQQAAASWGLWRETGRIGRRGTEIRITDQVV